MDDVEHQALGVFKPVNDEGWLGRSGPGADFYDLFVMRRSDEDAPSARALNQLADAVAQMGALKARAVDIICAARIGRLGWREGPPADEWSIIEARIDAGSALWLMLGDETDEYVRWLVRLTGDAVVRKIPALALQGAPDEAGVRV